VRQVKVKFWYFRDKKNNSHRLGLVKTVGRSTGGRVDRASKVKLVLLFSLALLLTYATPTWVTYAANIHQKPSGYSAGRLAGGLAQYPFPGGIDIVFLIDQSGSMSGTGGSNEPANDPSKIRMDGVTTVNNYLQFIYQTNKLYRESSNISGQKLVFRVGVISFGTTAEVDAPLTEINFESDDKLKEFNSQFTTKSLGNTNFPAAFDLAKGLFDKAGDPLPGQSRQRVIILVTDGRPYNLSGPVRNPSQYDTNYEYDKTEATLNQLKDKYRDGFDLWVTGLDANPNGTFWKESRGGDGKQFWEKVSTPNQATVVAPKDFGDRYIDILSALIKRVGGDLPIPNRQGDPSSIEVPPYLQQVNFLVVLRPPSKDQESIRVGPLSDPKGQIVYETRPGVKITKSANENFVNYEITKLPNEAGVSSGIWGFKELKDKKDKILAADTVYLSQQNKGVVIAEADTKIKYRQFGEAVEIRCLLYDRKSDGTKGDPLISDPNYPLTLEADLLKGSPPSEKLTLKPTGEAGVFVADQKITFTQSGGYTLKLTKLYYIYQSSTTPTKDGTKVDPPTPDPIKTLNIVNEGLQLNIDGLKAIEVQPSIKVNQFSYLDYQFKIGYADGTPPKEPLNPAIASFNLQLQTSDGTTQLLPSDKIKLDPATNTYKAEKILISSALAVTPILTVTTQTGSLKEATLNGSKLPQIGVSQAKLEVTKPTAKLEQSQDSTVGFAFKLTNLDGSPLAEPPLPEETLYKFNLTLSGSSVKSVFSVTNSGFKLDKTTGLYTVNSPQLTEMGTYATKLTISLADNGQGQDGPVALLYDRFPSIQIFKVTRITPVLCYTGKADLDPQPNCKTNEPLEVIKASPYLGLPFIPSFGAKDPDTIRFLFKLVDENGKPFNPAGVSTASALAGGVDLTNLFKFSFTSPTGKTGSLTLTPTSTGQGVIVVNLKSLTQSDYEAGNYTFSATTNEGLKREYCYNLKQGEKCDASINPVVKPLVLNQDIPVSLKEEMRLINQALHLVIFLIIAGFLFWFSYNYFGGKLEGKLELFDYNNPTQTRGTIYLDRSWYNRWRVITITPKDMGKVSGLISASIKKIKISKERSDKDEPPSLLLKIYEVDGGNPSEETLSAQPNDKILLSKNYYLRYRTNTTNTARGRTPPPPSPSGPSRTAGGSHGQSQGGSYSDRF